jgi:hypothetical protein
MSKAIIVIGDQFSDFVSGDSVLTISEFLKKINAISSDTKIMIGQGVSHDQAQYISTLANLEDNNYRIDVRNNVADLDITHKDQIKNVLITQPQKINKGIYFLQLALNDEMDRLLDHVTGCHIAGMVFIEAGRQALIAGTEMEYDLKSEGNSKGFVWNDCHVSFSKLAFPVPTDMDLILTEKEGSTAQNIKCLARIIFKQAGSEVCEVRIGYDLLPSQLLKKIEVRASKKMINSLTLCLESEKLKIANVTS